MLLNKWPHLLLYFRLRGFVTEKVHRKRSHRARAYVQRLFIDEEPGVWFGVTLIARTFPASTYLLKAVSETSRGISVSSRCAKYKSM